MPGAELLISKSILLAVVLAPLLGAIVAGLFGRKIGDKPAMAVTSGLLFLSAALSWVVFSQWT